MKKTILTYVTVAALIAIPALSFAQSTPTPTPAPVISASPVATPPTGVSASTIVTLTGGSSATIATVPPTGTSGSTLGSAVPPTGSSGSTLSPSPTPSPTPSPSPSVPPTGSSGSTLGTNFPPTGTSGSTLGNPTPTPTPTPTPATGGGSGPTGGGGNFNAFGGYSGTSSNIPFGTGSVGTLTGLSCPLLKVGLMEKGWNNDPVQVTKLQIFLKNTQEVDVDVTGTFDQKTEDGVKAFQARYMSTIMGPWGATAPSGDVYITTVKKINELSCQVPLSLTPAELAIIQSYQANDLAVSNTSTGTATNGTAVIGDGSSGTSTDIGSTVGQTGNTAAVGNLSIFQRFWNFIVSLFR